MKFKVRNVRNLKSSKTGYEFSIIQIETENGEVGDAYADINQFEPGDVGVAVPYISTRYKLAVKVVKA